MESLKKESEEEKLSIANSVYRKFGIPLEIRKLDNKEAFMSCIGIIIFVIIYVRSYLIICYLLELVSFPRAAEVNDTVRLYKINHALENPLMDIPKQDSSQVIKTQ